MMSALVSHGQSPINRFSKKEILSFVERDVKKEFPDFSVANFDRVALSAHASRGTYLLSFSNSINFVPLNSSYYYSAGFVLEMMNDQGKDTIRISQSILSPYSSRPGPNGSDFYVPNSDDKEKVKKVLDAANITKILETDVCFIIEYEQQFEITLVNDQVEGFWTVDKNKFTITRQGHNPLVPQPNQKNDWIKIDWK